jgi:hypothetical protein
MVKLAMISVLVLSLTGCNVVVSGKHIKAQYGDGYQTVKVEMTDFQITIPIEGVGMPSSPRGYQTATEGEWQ